MSFIYLFIYLYILFRYTAQTVGGDSKASEVLLGKKKFEIKQT